MQRRCASELESAGGTMSLVTATTRELAACAAMHCESACGQGGAPGVGGAAGAGGSGGAGIGGN
ncbi:MAG TPA: hypothetical protein VFB62_10740 [Polyangiaceae bacterium]|nr:hypothetical protein [Polyangiaceae bacterium]